MKLFWVSCYCSSNTFNKLFRELSNKPEVSIQNYFYLLLSGLKDAGVENITLCDRQISGKEKKHFWKGFTESDDYNKEIHYVPVITIPGISQLLRFFSVLCIMFWNLLKAKKPDAIICDIMRFWVSTPALLIGKLFRIKVIGYAADIPQMYNHQYKEKKSLFGDLQKIIYSAVTTHYDAYIELSSYMDICINPRRRPHIVIEGIVENPIKETNNVSVIRKENDKTIFLYSGGLYAKYGVKMLIDSVLHSSNPNIVLRLLGKGELETYLKSIDTEKIEYLGYCPHDKVLELQKTSDFLINPRYSNEEYTKYSFPSKIMEYLASGTPVISTRLKGIPEEYFNYILPIEEESVEGVLSVMEKAFRLSLDERFNLGREGRHFVSKYKSKQYQSNRLIDWINVEFNTHTT